MKKIIQFIVSAVLTVLIFDACKKSSDILPQLPPPLVDTGYYQQWTVSGIQQTGAQLYAIVSIENNAGLPVVINQRITVNNIQGTYKTDKVALPKGGYKLIKFVVVKSTDTAVYAAPRANTIKAALVTKPLAVDFALQQNGINIASVEVLKINESDNAAAFGYSVADFGFQPYTSIKVKLKINVGQVQYDNLPGKLKIDAVNSTGEHWSREIDLLRGINDIRLPEQYVNYTFEVSKWNTLATKILSRQELQPGMLVVLESARLPRRLIEEATFIENAAGLIPDSRTEYFYTAGLLTNIKVYQKSLQVSGLPLTSIYSFIYSGNLLDSIKRFNPDNSATGYTAFQYNTGRIVNISNKSYDQFIGAAIEYTAAGGHDLIDIDYLFDNGNSMNYKIFSRDGNKISDQALSSTGGSEGGTYEYDDNINPKHQLGYPDLFFSNASKNNRTLEQKNYGGSIPSLVPYKFEYVYNADGYPAEMYISYKGFTSNQQLFRSKTVFRYQ